MYWNNCRCSAEFCQSARWYWFKTVFSIHYKPTSQCHVFPYILHYVKLMATSAPHHSGQSQYVQQLFTCRKDSQCFIFSCPFLYFVCTIHNAWYQRPEQKSLQHDTIKSNYPLHSVTGHQMKEVFYDTFLAVIKTRVESRNLYLAITQNGLFFNPNCYLAICV